jgi:hypothetical protein
LNAETGRIRVWLHALVGPDAAKCPNIVFMGSLSRTGILLTASVARLTPVLEFTFFFIRNIFIQK